MMRVGIDADPIDLLGHLTKIDRHFKQRGRLAVEIGLLSARARLVSHEELQICQPTSEFTRQRSDSLTKTLSLATLGSCVPRSQTRLANTGDQIPGTIVIRLASKESN